ncbi:MAG: Gfo/Idh/MocA family oxidoreductase [Bacteroidota bacterium]
MKKINVAIVGFGLSGRYLQAPFFENNPDFHLKTIMTRQDVQAVFPQVQKADNFADILADADIDLVSISSPNETHFDYARQALLAGKHVLVEKPFTATVAEAEELIALAKKQEKHLFVFQNRRFDSDFLTVKKVIECEQLGELLRFEANFNRFKPALNVKKWKEIPNPANGILYDLGAHLIDQCVALFGAPQKVWGQTYTQRNGSSIDDAFDIQLDYGRLKVCLTASLLVRDPTPRYVLRGLDGAFVKYGIDVQEDQLKAGLGPEYPDFGRESDAHGGVVYTEIDGYSVQEIIETEQGNWRLLFQNIADVLLRGAAPVIQMEEVLVQLGIMEQVRHS